MKTKIKISAGERIFDVFNNIFMLLMLVVTLYPMLYVAFASFSDPGEFAKVDSFLLRPAGFSLEAYKAVFKMSNIGIGFRNTAFYLAAGTLLSMILTVFGAYALSKQDFYLRRPIMILLTVTMFFSGGMIPTYLVVNHMHMTDTILAVLIPGCISTYNLIVMRTAFEGIPVSLIESAEMDGANQFTIMMRIVVPLSAPTLATITLFYAVGRWGDWYSALVYLQGRRDLYPLQMFLREMLVKGDMTDPSYVSAISTSQSASYLLNQVVKYATIVVTTLPILMVYPFLQRYFVKGVMIGAIKE